ncbi:MAG: AMP-binding protein [Planctomycetota bacterium]
MTIVEAQRASLVRLIETQLAAGGFHAGRLRKAGIEHARGLDIERFIGTCPLLSKEELRRDQAEHPPHGTMFPAANAGDAGPWVRLHQTSSTSGEPIRWLDTQRSWDAMVDGWCDVLEAAGIGPEDRVFAAASFGPFIGFWLGFEAAVRRGAMAVPGGGMSTEIRLRAITANGITAVLCTPTYAIRLAEAARDLGIDLAQSDVKRLVVAGEPGGSVPEVRRRIERLWGGRARVFDHHGMTECGPATHECPERPGVLHLIEKHLLCEFRDPVSGGVIEPDGSRAAELVLTSLTRVDAPVLRYRTGDLVRPEARGVCVCGRAERTLLGGVIGRVDDMVVVRGVNIFPSAVDGVVNGTAGIDEYFVEVSESRGMTELSVHAESADPGAPSRLEAALRGAFGLRIPVRHAPGGSLPRDEFKAKRWRRGAP